MSNSASVFKRQTIPCFDELASKWPGYKCPDSSTRRAVSSSRRYSGNKNILWSYVNELFRRVASNFIAYIKRLSGVCAFVFVHASVHPCVCVCVRVCMCVCVCNSAWKVTGIKNLGW